MLRSLSALAVLACVVAGCSGAGSNVPTSPQSAYERGKMAYDEGKYLRAIESLQSVFDFGRAHEYAADAQYFLGKAYYEDGQFLLAANDFDRFSQLYPTDARVEEAQFLRAMSYYNLSPRYELDQTDTERAINYLRLFASRYPASERVPEIGRRIDQLQEKLARKLFEGAMLYERQEQFEPAALTYERVLAKYPNTSYADDAMVAAMRAYIAYADISIEAKREERLDKAISIYDRLVQIFPDSPLLKEAEAQYDAAQNR
ncbi:MAG: outer membrane protein assembly factor BamD, partial [Bacteroidota bacterium]